MAELTNCKSCGKLFVQNTLAVCPSCRQEIEKKFETVWKYIRKRENREATVYQIQEETGVEEKLIFQWIQEGRLQVKDFKNLFVPCELCGAPAQSGKVCESCKTNLTRDLKTLQDEETSQNKTEKSRTYFTR
jgi:flagellar operon protein (TIGR03826 family)